MHCVIAGRTLGWIVKPASPCESYKLHCQITRLKANSGTVSQELSSGLPHQNECTHSLKHLLAAALASLQLFLPSRGFSYSVTGCGL